MKYSLLTSQKLHWLDVRGEKFTKPTVYIYILYSTHSCICWRSVSAENRLKKTQFTSLLLHCEIL